MTDSRTQSIGIVVIGRNEGARLRRCLASLGERIDATVYVDSGSTDGSVSFAHAIGAEVVELDTAVPFSAARARNAGFDHLIKTRPHIDVVQFIDGDCELIDGWLDAAAAMLRDQPDIAIVCGRLHERHPDASIYNRLCDIEWRGPIGDVDGCGGIFMARVSAFVAIGRFNPDVVAGEEPELCLRLRRAKWRIHRLAEDMAHHDAAITRFAQWWRRTTRTGYAYALGAQMHARERERFNQRQVVGIIAWAIAVPLLTVAATVVGIWFAPLVALAAYAVLFGRVYQWRVRIDTPAHAALYAWFCVLGKWPQAVGCMRYLARQWRGERNTIIEYKQPTTS